MVHTPDRLRTALPTLCWLLSLSGRLVSACGVAQERPASAARIERDAEARRQIEAIMCSTVLQQQLGRRNSDHALDGRVIS